MLKVMLRPNHPGSPAIEYVEADAWTVDENGVLHCWKEDKAVASFASAMWIGVKAHPFSPANWAVNLDASVG